MSFIQLISYLSLCLKMICLDQTNASLTVLMCGSVFGALPLGAIVTSGQDELCYTEGKH